MPVLQRLPFGTNTFSNIRDNGYLYVDKTQYLVDLIDEGERYFLSRPRRFGKSLTVSTLESMFRGEKHLFKGLNAEEWFNRNALSPHPVISLSFAAVCAKSSIDVMRDNIKTRVNTIAEYNGLSLKDTNPSDMFFILINKMYLKYGKKVVILIDEYDHPMLDFIDNPPKINVVREELQAFFSVMKDEDAHIRFVFITGVTKFSKVGLFSALNNLKDISLYKKFASLCGCTQEELDTYFPEYIAALAKKTSKAIDVVKDKIIELYNGFCFDGETYIYNIYSLVCLFDQNKFGDYWFESSTPTYIEKFLAGKTVVCSDYINYEVPLSKISAPKEIEDVDIAVFLYQAGYLTLRATQDENIYALVYPNEEVENAMLRLVSNNLFKSKIEIIRGQNLIIDCLLKDDIEGLICEFGALLSLGGYDTYAKITVKPVSYECYIRDIIAAFLAGTCRIVISQEVFGSIGRSDIVAKLNIENHIKVYLLELRMIDKGANPEKMLVQLKNEIIAKKYAGQHFFVTDIVTAIPIIIERDARKIVLYDVMKLEKVQILRGKRYVEHP